MATGKSESAADLRARAERDVLAREAERAPDFLPEKLQRLVHELEVHQIELESQNEELRRSRLESDCLRGKYQDLFDFAPVAFFSFDISGTIQELNLTAAQLLGENRQALIGRSFMPFVAADSMGNFRAFCRCAYQSQIRESCDLRLSLVPSRMVEVELIGKAATNPGSTEKLLRVACVDVTQRNRLSRDRERLILLAQRAQANAESANRAKDEFLAVISHELRTPLTPMLVWTRLMQNKTVELSGDKGLDIMERNIRSLSRLIDDLLNVPRIIAGKFSLDRQDVDFRSIVDQTAETERSDAAAKKISFEYSADEGNYAINGDPDRLRQIVANLVCNALKFTPCDGTVKVHLGIENGQAALTIRDTGIGIEPEFLPHIFNRFQQGNKSITREFKGLGLGLSIVRHLVDSHGGTIEAASDGIGKGALFTVRLPMRKQSGRQAARGAAAFSHNKTPDLKGIEVLIVEDERDTADVLALALERYGARVRKACTAAEALTLFDEMPPRVILSDIGLPGTDGYQLIHDIRSRPLGAKIPAIALTAFVRPEDRIKALECGFHLHLAKPVEITLLADVIRSMATAAS